MQWHLDLRAAWACGLVLAALVPGPPAMAAPAPPPSVDSVAVLPIRAKGKASRALLEVLDDLLLAAVQGAAGDSLRVVGKSDIDAMLGFEKTKDMAGCSEVACAAEIAGALGVDSIITASAGTLGGKYVLTLSWIEQRQGRALRRHSETLGKTEEDFDAGVGRAVAGLFGTSPSPGARAADAVWDQSQWDRDLWGP